VEEGLGGARTKASGWALHILLGSRNLSKQHVIPDVLCNILPRKHESHQQWLTRFDLDSPGTIVIKPSTRDHQGHLGVKKLRRVCEKCNNTWLSGSEQRAFALLKPAILGKDYSFDADSSADLALTLATMAVMIDLTDLETSAISQAERSFIFENRRPPANWFIYIGKTHEEEWLTRYRHHGANLEYVEESKVRKESYHVCTVGMGKMIFHVTSVPTRLINIDSIEYAKKFGIGRIFPPREFGIGSKYLPWLGEERLRNLSDHFSLDVAVKLKGMAKNV